MRASPPPPPRSLCRIGTRRRQRSGDRGGRCGEAEAATFGRGQQPVREAEPGPALRRRRRRWLRRRRGRGSRCAGERRRERRRRTVLPTALVADHRIRDDVQTETRRRGASLRGTAAQRAEVGRCSCRASTSAGGRRRGRHRRRRAPGGSRPALPVRKQSGCSRGAGRGARQPFGTAVRRVLRRNGGPPLAGASPAAGGCARRFPRRSKSTVMILPSP